MRRRLVDALPGAPTSLALLQDPASLLSMPLLRPLVQRSALLAASAPAGAAAPGIDEGGPARALAGLVIAADRGALLAADGPEGWLLGTAADAPDPSSLEAALAARGLTPAPLERPDGPLLVWTRLSAGAGRSGTLQASLEGWRALRQGVAWWGGSLAALDARAGGATVDRRLRQLETLASPAAPLQWAMSGEPARRLLGGWTPWRLLAVLAGGDLDTSVRGLALAVDPATPAAEPAGRPLTFRASLEFG
jgi:hypothetical protein